MSLKKIFLVLILISVLAIVITAIEIVKHNTQTNRVANNPVAQEAVKSTSKPVTTAPEVYLTYHRNVKDNASGITKNFYYDTNSLKWEKKKYEDNKSLIFYMQMSGLLNKDIEASVNKKLKDAAFKFNQDLQTQYSKSNESQFLSFLVNDNNQVISSQAVSASFGNVISVVNYSYAYGDLTFCNIDLNSGKDLKFEDMFTSNTDIKQLLSSVFIKKLGDNKTIEYYNKDSYYDDEQGKMVEIEYGDAFFKEVDVRTLERAIKRFFATDKIEFGFTDNNLIFRFPLTTEKPTNFYINYSEHLDNIAIFSRFNSKNSLFENDKYSVKRVRALYGLGSFNTLRESKILLEDNGVILNYVIRLNSGSCSFDEYNILAEKLTQIIKDRINSDLEGIRQNVDVNQVPVFNGCFRINIFKTDFNTYGKVNNDTKISSEYLSEGKVSASIEYNPSVYVVSREDANTLINSEYVKIAYTSPDYMGYLNIDTWYNNGKEWGDIVNLQNKFYPYYEEVAQDLYIKSSSDNYIIKDSKFYIQEGGEVKQLSSVDFVKYLLYDRNKYENLLNTVCEEVRARIENDNWITDKEEILQNINKDNVEIKIREYDQVLEFKFKTGRGSSDYYDQPVRICSDYPYTFPYLRRL